MNIESVSTARVSIRPPVPAAFLRRPVVSAGVATSNAPLVTEEQQPADSAKTAIDPVLSADERVRLVCALAQFRRPVEGRDAVSQRTAQIALALQDQAASQGFWLPPHVSRSPNGEVVFEWWCGDRKLTVYVGEHVREFVRVWGADIDSEMADGTIAGGSDLASHLRWLQAGS